MAQYSIFIVEDDPWYGELLKYHLSLNPDYTITLFQTAKECINNLYKKPDVISIDFGLPDMAGNKLLEQIKSFDSTIPVIIISGQDDIAVAVELLKSGASDYLTKNDNTKELLWNAIIRLRETSSLRKEVEELKQQLGQKFNDNSILGQSSGIKKLQSLIDKATKTNINVSITGETGTGKEVVAKAIHYNSDRKKKPFIAVNMSAIPKELIESELFGHEKGAFTGALNRVKGKFEEAQGGTIFLDEIAELDINLQSKILRVLQEREVIRVGGNEKIKLDVRLLVATHRNLAEEVKKGTFREDLYYRIIGLPIELPPLRERGNDILILAKHFVDSFAKENKMKNLILSSDAKNKLLKYHYPGNVRELKAVIDLACVMSDGNEITTEDITFSSIRQNDLMVAEEKTLKEYTSDIIQYYLNKYNNDVLDVAARLDIGKSTIYNMIKNGQVSTLK